MDDSKNIIIVLLVIIIVLLSILVLMPKSNNTAEITDNATVSETENNSATPDTITVELPDFDTEYTKTVGDYTVKAEKWMGGSVGGFEVHLYKNGEPVNKDSYLTRAYFYKDGEWKWSEWGNGENGYEGYHRYPVSNGVEIDKVEVKF